MLSRSKKHDQYYILLVPFFPDEVSFRGSYIYDQAVAISEISDLKLIVIKYVLFGKTTTYEFNGILVHQIRLMALPSFLFPGLFQFFNVLRVKSFLARELEIDLASIRYIHGHIAVLAGGLAVRLAKEIGAKSIIQHHGFDILGYTNGCFGSKSLRRLNKIWIDRTYIKNLNAANLNIGVSQKTLESLKNIDGYVSTKEYILYNGVDKNKFYPKAGFNKFRPFTIGCIANFWEIKDQLTLLKAFHMFCKDNSISGAILKLVGDGPTLDSCKKFVADKNLQSQVRFITSIRHNDLVEFYNELDLFILPSYFEAFGCVYVEAFACGVPFIGVEDQGIEEILPEHLKEDYLISKSDIYNLARLIGKFHRKEVDKLELVKPIDIRQIIAKYLDYLNLDLSDN